MNPQNMFCPHPDCPMRGQVGGQNLVIHSRKEKRYRCLCCGHTFVERKGTPYYRLHHAEEWFTCVVTLLAYGCPPQAIVAAFGLDERTVAAWQQRAGRHCEQVHRGLV